MPSDPWQSSKDLFHAALDLAPADREAFVRRQGADEAVRDEVLRLLRLHDESSSFLVSPLQTPASDPPSDPLIGRSLGGFSIVRRIGVGGIGVVYEAVQDQPHRRAAVKVLRPGIFSSSMMRRFEFESEVLARLKHPGIAQVFAAGTFEQGGGLQPWFAMELIEGPTLQSFGNQRLLSHAQRIELLIRVCDAVHHAHLNGVVHRDLKPDNILIEAASDGNARPKVLDFGVARSVGAGTRATMHTVAGELVGTLSYMSPEQLAGNPDSIDARSDVFSLGVIAYELLSGRLPHAGDSLGEIVRAIEHDDPPRLGLLDRSLRGDLEIILTKALEKDPARRYQSAADLGADFRRCLNNEPTTARPATAMYKFSKFARRNRRLVGGLAATFLALATGMTLYAREARIARREADRSRYEAEKATAINNFITNDFLMTVLGPATSARPAASDRPPIEQLIREASDRAGEMFASRPLDEAAVRNEIGTIRYNIGDYDGAAEQFQRALTLWESNVGADHPDTLKAVNNLGLVRARQKRPAEAEPLYRRALEGRRRVLGEDDPATLVVMNNLAELCRGTDRLDEAEALLRAALLAQKRSLGALHTETITSQANLAALLLQRRKIDEAATLLREAHQSSKTLLGPDHPLTAMTGVRLAVALQRLGRPADAEPILLAVIESGARSLGPDHPETINARRTLARGYKDQGRTDAAALQLREALATLAAKPGESGDLVKRIQRDLDELAAPSVPKPDAPAKPAPPKK